MCVRHVVTISVLAIFITELITQIYPTKAGGGKVLGFRAEFDPVLVLLVHRVVVTGARESNDTVARVKATALFGRKVMDTSIRAD